MIILWSKDYGMNSLENISINNFLFLNNCKQLILLTKIFINDIHQFLIFLKRFNAFFTAINFNIRNISLIFQ